MKDFFFIKDKEVGRQTAFPLEAFPKLLVLEE